MTVRSKPADRRSFIGGSDAIPADNRIPATGHRARAAGRKKQHFGTPEQAPRRNTSQLNHEPRTGREPGQRRADNSIRPRDADQRQCGANEEWYVVTRRSLVQGRRMRPRHRAGSRPGAPHRAAKFAELLDRTWRSAADDRRRASRRRLHYPYAALHHYPDTYAIDGGLQDRDALSRRPAPQRLSCSAEVSFAAFCTSRVPAPAPICER